MFSCMLKLTFQFKRYIKFKTTYTDGIFKLTVAIFMSSTSIQFIGFALQQNILQFGEFTLKSGRKSPYFFNAGLFCTGMQLAKLGMFYADTLLEAKLEFDVLFGPAYKGLPLGTATAIALFSKGVNIEVSFNRKEAKKHGEQGVIIGAPLAGKKVVMIDDVITAGTAYKESKSLIEAAGGQLTGVIVALDRQEPASLEPHLSKQSTLSSIQEHDGIPVLAIATLNDIKSYLESMHQTQQLQKILDYQASLQR